MTKFNTTEFQFSHGHTPRGRGSWAFYFGTDEPWFAPGSMLYQEAKKMAKQEAKRRGFNGVIGVAA